MEVGGIPLYLRVGFSPGVLSIQKLFLEEVMFDSNPRVVLSFDDGDVTHGSYQKKVHTGEGVT